jgi:ketosteroid isomerase-like protein
MRETSEQKNEQVLRALHAAWSRARLDEAAKCVTDDLIYWSNIGNADEPLILTGKQAFQGLMETIVAHYECSSTVRELTWREGRAHARIAHTIRHKESGHTLRGMFRQIADFRDSRIERIEEYYDAAKLQAFRRLVNAP